MTLLKGHYQNAYVTHDYKRAMATITEKYGVKDYITFEPEIILKTPQGDKPASMKVALAWIGTLQIELIEPVSGYVDSYTELLPADKSDIGLRFHHIALRRADEDAMRAEIAQLGYPIAFEGGVPGVTFIYVDARRTFGHFIEYMWSSPEGWEMQGWPKGRPVD